MLVAVLFLWFVLTAFAIHARPQDPPPLKGERSGWPGKPARRQNNRTLDASQCAATGDSVFPRQAGPDGPVATSCVRHVGSSWIRLRQRLQCGTYSGDHSRDMSLPAATPAHQPAV